MKTRAPLTLLAGLAGIALLAGCQSGAEPSPSASDASESTVGDGHGAIAGARELAEPALHLTSIDPDGAVHHLDLLDEESESLGSIAPADTVDSEGRFLFAGRSGEVSIVDSGVWTWNHIDHFHYYEAPSQILGEVAGAGTPTTVASDLGAGVHFDGGEAVLLDLEALKGGDIVERFRLETAPGAGMVVPLPSGALLAEPGSAELRHLDSDGEELETVACVDPAGSIATNVGVVVGCADGAVLAVTSGEETTFERIPYPAGEGAEAPTRALSFSAREGRPTVAGPTGTSGFWLLDTRERTWIHHDTAEAPLRVAAVDDENENVVALYPDGTVAVISGATGEQVARTAPLVAASLADPARAAGVSLDVDQRRTYLNGPLEGVMYELDVADGARTARTFSTEHAPALLVETGR